MYKFVKFEQQNNILLKYRYTFLFLLFICSSISTAQNNRSAFKNLTSPEKFWVLFHLFKAKKAYRISIEATRVSDSIAKTKLLDQDKNGGQVDAFRHAFWMATLSQEIGKKSAKKLGKAHEKGNYKQFKKNKLEEGSRPDQKSSEMDSFNNNIGIEIFKNNKKASKNDYITLVITQINRGKLKVLKKAPNGAYLDCNNQLLAKNEYLDKWENSKCLIPSAKQ